MCLGVSWQPLGYCKCPDHPPDGGMCSVRVGHLVFPLGCATASCFFVLEEPALVKLAGLTGLEGR